MCICGISSLSDNRDTACSFPELRSNYVFYFASFCHNDGVSHNRDGLNPSCSFIPTSLLLMHFFHQFFISGNEDAGSVRSIRTACTRTPHNLRCLQKVIAGIQSTSFLPVFPEKAIPAILRPVRAISYSINYDNFRFAHLFNLQS